MNSVMIACYALTAYCLYTIGVVNDNCPETDGIFKFKNE